VRTYLPRVASLATLLDELATVKAENDALRQKVSEQAVEIHSLRARVEMMCRRLYGRSAEHVSREQLEFAFQALEKEGLVDAPDRAPEADSGEASEEKPKKPRKKRTRKNKVSPDIPREEVVHAPEHTTCSCCNGEMARIGEERSEEIIVVPAIVKVLEHVRPKFACPKCKDGVEIAEPPKKLFDRGRYGTSFVAHVATSKYADHLPLYRQAQIFARQGLEVADTTLVSLLERSADLLAPIVESIWASIALSHVIGADETPIGVKQRPAGRRRGYLWAYAGDRNEVFFEYYPTRAGRAAMDRLGEYRGTVQADGYVGYDQVFRKGFARHAGCWAHGRRYVKDAMATERKAAGRAMALIQRMYAVEAEAKDFGDVERMLLRQEKAKPMVQAFFDGLEEARERALPKSPWGKALGYLLGRRQALELYLEDGRIPIDSNRVERAIRPIALGRRNWLLAGSDRGARWAATFYTLIGTCKLQGVEPFAYLTDVLDRVSVHPRSRIDELTPRLWKNLARA
jgi:transposase